MAAYPFGPAPVRNGWLTDPAIVADNPLMSAIARAARSRRQPTALPATRSRAYLSAQDGDGRALNGTSRYVLHFAPSALPPAGAYWTLTALSETGAMADAGRPAIAGNASDLRRNPDGSIDIAVQSTSPDDPAANWLAAPSGPFGLILRVYAPVPEGNWRPPAVDRREGAA